MFDEIMEKFSDSPGQQAVIRLCCSNGASPSTTRGRVVSGGIEIPNTGIAREVGVDRRVVDATTRCHPRRRGTHANLHEHLGHPEPDGPGAGA